MSVAVGEVLPLAVGVALSLLQMVTLVIARLLDRLTAPAAQHHR